MSKIYVDYTDCVPVGGVKAHGGAEYARRMMSIMAANKVDIVVIIPSAYKEYIDSDKKFFAQDYVQVQSLESMAQFKVKETGAILFIPLMATHRLKQIAVIKSNNPNLGVFVTMHGTRMMDLKPDKWDKYYENSKIGLFYGVVNVLRYNAANLLCKHIFKKYISYFDGVLTVSNDSMQKIQKISNPKELTLYYCGSHYYDESDIQAFGNLEKDNTFLFLSGGRPEKNLLRTLFAFQKFKETDENGMKMIVTGVNEAVQKNFRACKLIDWKALEQYLTIKSYVSDEELTDLYRRCKYVLYPSKSEGFGLPLIDSCYFGLPSLTSSITATPEVLGSAAVYVNPYSVESIVDGMKRLTNMDYQILLDSIQRVQVRVKSSIEAADKDFVQYMKSKLDLSNVETGIGKEN